MAATKFLVTRPGGELTDPIHAPQAVDLLERYMHPRGPWWRQKMAGDEWGPHREDWNALRDRAAARLRKMAPGDRLMVDGEYGAYVYVAHAIDPEPPLINTEGNDRIDAIWTWSRAWCREHNVTMRSGGCCVKKNVAGTSDPSQHNPWVPDGSNAVDIFLATMALEVEMAEDAVRAARRGELPLGRAIVANRIWDPVQDWHGYTGEYHWHDHLEGRPEQSGAIKASCP